MLVKLKNLTSGTIFTVHGQTFKKGHSFWSPVGANLTEEDYIGPKNPLVSIIECPQKLGGQFQDNIKQWISEETVVTVN